MGPGYCYSNEEQQGGSIGSAKKALGLFLHSLPSDCYFNIFSFGSHFDSLFQGSVKYEDDSLVKAVIEAYAFYTQFTHVKGLGPQCLLKGLGPQCLCSQCLGPHCHSTILVPDG